ncbi:tRNA (adenosine(37)-N6)-threonylcarbamoyltransferase complex ATPase subunit type 1 TsaE [Salinispirillum sp. LH 10-3-1]|uniref:tRNA threonylcarbamoyladenosine biosynthesis protein TsaE n=1 Tax=Salinispirillum sp. LH 10-3-1 TaxID=2952525 RepID=A0AB38YEF6_9GAMM
MHNSQQPQAVLQSGHCVLQDADETESIGAALAAAAQRGVMIYLLGDLGMGKTTLTRGFLRGLGWEGTVKSPTYTLVEAYEWDDNAVYHFDLYRLGDPEELEFIGIRDYDTPSSVCLIEWPERGAGVLRPADLVLALTEQGSGRVLEWSAYSPIGQLWAQRLEQWKPA